MCLEITDLRNLHIFNTVSLLMTYPAVRGWKGPRGRQTAIETDQNGFFPAGRTSLAARLCHPNGMSFWGGLSVRQGPGQPPGPRVSVPFCKTPGDTLSCSPPPPHFLPPRQRGCGELGVCLGPRRPQEPLPNPGASRRRPLPSALDPSAGDLAVCQFPCFLRVTNTPSQPWVLFFLPSRVFSGSRDSWGPSSHPLGACRRLQSRREPWGGGPAGVFVPPPAA